MKQKSNDEVLNDIKRLNLAVDKKKQSNAPIAGKSAREGQVRSAGAHAESEGGGGTLPSVTERRSHEPSFQVSSFPEPRKAGPRRRLEDTIAPVSPETGRLIVRYSWTNRFRAFSFLDMLGTMATIWNPKRDFFINRRFARSLLCGSGKHAGSVSLYSLSDTLEELSWIAGRLMGSWSSIHSASIVRELDKATGYVGVPYLGYFLSLDSAIFTDQSYLRQRFLEGDRIPVRALAWSVKCVWGLSLITEAVPLKTARRIVETAWEINRKVIENEYAGFAAQKRKLTEELALYPPVFLRLLENLRQFRKELYPALLFLIGGFYPYQDNTAEKR